MKKFFPSRRVLIALAVLGVGQLLYLFGFRLLFVLGLIYFIAVAIPYPAVCRSLFSRLVVSFVLILSLLQVVATVQFFVLPNTGFAAISLLTSLVCVCLAVLFRSRPTEQPVLFAKRDVQAVVMSLFFLLPVAFLFFGSLSSTRILTFTGIQSQDAISHYNGIEGMDITQHLDYRTNSYYPRGFHLASAFMLDGVHANQQDLDWIQGQRVYAGMYIAWGAVLGYLIFYLASQALEALNKQAHKKYADWLLAIVLGPIIALLYLIPFVYYGFLNYYYVAAAVICGLLYMYEHNRERLATASLAMYMLCVFGISMSWGPLLAPALFLIPTLYILDGKGPKQLVDLLRRKAFWIVLGVYIIELVPLWLHVKYARLNSEQGINATGIITDFHFGIVLMGLGLLLYFLVRSQATRLHSLVTYSLVSFYALLSLLIAIQYFSAGDLRYYAIKTSYLVEMIVLAFLAACFIWLCLQHLKVGLREWLALPLVFTMVCILSLSLTANPLLPVRQVFRSYSGYGMPGYYTSDVNAFARLGTEHKLRASNNEVLHYDPAVNKIYGNVLIRAAADATQFTTGGTPASGMCSGTIFSILAYGTGSPTEQSTLVAALKSCIAAVTQRGDTYYVVTDAQSAPYLRDILGGNVTYVY